MRAKEFMTEQATAGATSAASVATVVAPLGTTVISRKELPKEKKKSVNKVNK
jgi:bifunctional ADP-heptose synthase (sugar kinase/adenylyltransferase)